MKKWFNKNKLYVIGSFTGAIAGYFYWQQVGCSSGTCIITSKPVNSTIYGAMMGALLFSMFKKESKQTILNKEDKNL
jgi:outer membrane lipoprotein SlyB